MGGWMWLLAVLVAGVCSGCGTVSETAPARTATEQALISSAADRAIDAAELDGCRGKKVFVDATNLKAYDQEYVIRRLQKAILDRGGRVSDTAEGAQVTLQVAAGALSVDKSSFLIGIPSLNIPVPATGIVQTPELAIFKLSTQHGRAKLLVNVVGPKSRARL